MPPSFVESTETSIGDAVRCPPNGDRRGAAEYERDDEAAPVFFGADRSILKSCSRLDAFLWRERPRPRRNERPPPLLLLLLLPLSLPSVIVLYLRGAGDGARFFREKKRERGDGSRFELAVPVVAPPVPADIWRGSGDEDRLVPTGGETERERRRECDEREPDLSEDFRCRRPSGSNSRRFLEPFVESSEFLLRLRLSLALPLHVDG